MARKEEKRFYLPSSVKAKRKTKLSTLLLTPSRAPCPAAKATPNPKSGKKKEGREGIRQLLENPTLGCSRIWGRGSWAGPFRPHSSGAGGVVEFWKIEMGRKGKKIIIIIMKIGILLVLGERLIPRKIVSSCQTHPLQSSQQLISGFKRIQHQKQEQKKPPNLQHLKVNSGLR